MALPCYVSGLAETVDKASVKWIAIQALSQQVVSSKRGRTFQNIAQKLIVKQMLSLNSWTRAFEPDALFENAVFLKSMDGRV